MKIADFLSFDLSFFKSTRGILLIVGCICLIIAIILIATGGKKKDKEEIKSDEEGPKEGEELIKTENNNQVENTNKPEIKEEVKVQEPTPIINEAVNQPQPEASVMPSAPVEQPKVEPLVIEPVAKVEEPVAAPKPYGGASLGTNQPLPVKEEGLVYGGAMAPETKVEQPVVMPEVTVSPVVESQPVTNPSVPNVEQVAAVPELVIEEPNPVPEETLVLDVDAPDKVPEVVSNEVPLVPEVK